MRGRGRRWRSSWWRRRSSATGAPLARRPVHPPSRATFPARTRPGAPCCTAPRGSRWQLPSGGGASKEPPAVPAERPFHRGRGSSMTASVCCQAEVLLAECGRRLCCRPGFLVGRRMVGPSRRYPPDAVTHLRSQREGRCGPGTVGRPNSRRRGFQAAGMEGHCACGSSGRLEPRHHCIAVSYPTREAGWRHGTPSTHPVAGYGATGHSRHSPHGWLAPRGT